MILKRLFKLNVFSLLKSNNLISLKLKLEEWIRQEIVADDPWDTEELSSESDESDGLKPDLQRGATQSRTEKILEFNRLPDQNRSHP